MTWAEIGDLTLEQLHLELGSYKPLNQPERLDAKTKRQFSLLDAICFNTAMRPIQLKDVSMVRLSVLAREISPSFLIEKSHLVNMESVVDRYMLFASEKA